MFEKGDFQKFSLEAPINRWDEAIPLGNGLVGGLLWGGDGDVRLSLDRGDLWDLREHPVFSDGTFGYETIISMARAGNTDELNERYTHKSPFPTKLPGARLVIERDDLKATSFDLDMGRAMGSVNLEGGEIECYLHATSPLVVFSLPEPDFDFHLVPNEAVKILGYRPAEVTVEGRRAWLSQDAALGLRYVVYCEAGEVDGENLLMATVTTNRDREDPLELAAENVGKAIGVGPRDLRKAHNRWWADFWSRSSVSIPDARIQGQYNLVQYLYGAGSRVGAPPLALQGVWTADEGKLPPWHGDYHHDLNTQLTYWAYLAPGRIEEGYSFLEFMWSHLETHREFARDFYGLEKGHVVPGVMALDGGALGDWFQYTFTPTNGAWIAQAFYLHWLYTMDEKFLAERAYPYCSGIAGALLELTSPDPETGKLKLPLSSSPEIHNNSQQAWLTPNSNFDLSLLRWLLTANEQMALAMGGEEDVKMWRQNLDRLEGLATDETGLMLSPDESLGESHRHHSHLMAIHPLGLIDIEGGDEERKIIEDSIANIKALGTGAWVGYSFSWMACILARVGRGDDALRYLRDFVTSFTLRNGFHCNGEQTRRGLSDFHYRPFTLEGNFAAAQAVHEMLLQSWGGRLRVFPAVPAEWGEVSFDKLRAEGGYIVSAKRRCGRTTELSVEATVDGSLLMVNPFGESFQSDADLEISGDELRRKMLAGDSVTIRRVTTS